MNGKHLLYRPLLWLVGVCALMMACTDLTDVENDIKELQGKVTKLKDAVAALQTAYEDGRLSKL
ncbi:MAG: hypothetical protein LUE99_14810 [Bacteroides sp.]|nr:hypothetical protein [Bacteroides sp.]